MDEIMNLDTVSKYNDRFGVETLHPLVSVVDFSKCGLIESHRMRVGFYTVFLKEVKCGEMLYGRGTYDYQEGTMVFLAPGQCYGINTPGPVAGKGWALVFHPDLLRGTQLGRNIRQYTFFSYEVNEALHLSEQERRTILDCLHNIDHELHHAIDKHSRTLIVNNIEMLLNYCVRFYDRQFITRSEVVNKGVVSRFERLLDDYLDSDKPQIIGLPTVQYCAGELHLSPNYFGDLIKRETGHTAQEHIRLRLIDAAKERVLDRSRSISEIAYDLGFKYPAHFTRLFKNTVGCTPVEYRNVN